MGLFSWLRRKKNHQMESHNEEACCEERYMDDLQQDAQNMRFKTSGLEQAAMNNKHMNNLFFRGKGF